MTKIYVAGHNGKVGSVIVRCSQTHQAWAVGVQRLLLLGSSCIYPKLAS